MRHVRFIGIPSNVQCPKFCNADLTHAFLQGNFWSPDFSGANLTKAIIETTALRCARFNSKSTIDNITLILAKDENSPPIVNATKENLLQHYETYWVSEAQ